MSHSSGGAFYGQPRRMPPPKVPCVVRPGAVTDIAASGRSFQIRVLVSNSRPDIRAAMAANLTGEQRLQIGQPDMIRPAVAVDLDMMRALVVAAIDQQPARAGCPHFSEGDFLFTLGHRRGYQLSKKRPQRGG